MIGYTEAKALVSAWHKGSFNRRSESIKYHFSEHGLRVGAENVGQYLRKSVAFRQQVRGRGIAVPGDTPGVRRYPKQERYIDLAPDGAIVSFGSKAKNT